MDRKTRWLRDLMLARFGMVGWFIATTISMCGLADAGWRWARNLLLIGLALFAVWLGRWMRRSPERDQLFKLREQLLLVVGVAVSGVLIAATAGKCLDVDNLAIRCVLVGVSCLVGGGVYLLGMAILERTKS